MPKEITIQKETYYSCKHCKALFEHFADAVEHEERYHNAENWHTEPMPKYFIGDLIGFGGHMYIVRDLELCQNTNMNLYSISAYREFCARTEDAEGPFMFADKTIKVYEDDITGRINKGKLLEATRRLLKVYPFTHAEVQVMSGYGNTTLTKLFPSINLGLGNE